jgi:sugar/nucleoside kinase (ribokinase family)
VENFKAMEKIIGLGNALTDIMAVLSDDSLFTRLNIPKGSTQFIERNQVPEVEKLFSTMETKKVTGGSSANTIRALAHVGVPTGYIGKVGHDETGDFYINNMKSVGIDTHFHYSELPSGIASTLISPDGERTFIDYLGAAATLTASDITPDAIKGSSYFYVEGYLVQDHEMLLHALKVAKEQHLKICMDMANFNIVAGDLDFFKQLIHDYVDIVFANEQEAQAFVQGSVEQAIEEFGRHCDIAVVKVGSKGSYIRHEGKTVKVEPKAIDKVIDTNGAGDYFAAGFMYGLVNGCSMEQCGQLGSLFSYYVIQILGTSITDQQWKSLKEEAALILSK